MKKNYLFGMLALAAMTMVGCSNDEVVNDYSQDNAIQFGTYVGRGAESRAHVIDTKTLGTEGFGVFAYYHEGENNTPGAFSSASTPDFMYNEQVTNTGNWDETNGFDTDWTYDPVKYWPNNANDRVSFFAYAPWQQTTPETGDNFNFNENTGLPTIEFTVNGTVKDQQDLLWAAPKMNVQKQKIEENVEFEFKHALSRIGFEVQTMIDKVNPDGVDDDKEGNVDDDDNTGNGKELDVATTVVVKQVTLNGAFSTTGTLTWVEDNNGGYTASIIGDAEENTTYTLTSENFNSNEEHSLGAKDEKYSVEGQSVDETEAPLNNSESYIMIIPKNFENGDNLTIEVIYDVVTADSSLPKGYSAVTNKISSTFDNIEFKVGYAYKFSLHLGLTTVKLAAQVAPWEEQQGEDWAVNLPLNTTTVGGNN